MKGFLATAAGFIMVLLLAKLYVAWISTADLDKSITSYARLLNDSYKRAGLEDAVYDALSSAPRLCRDERNIHTCETVINTELRRVLARYGIIPACEKMISLSMLPTSLAPVVVCPVEGRIGSVLFRLVPGVST